MVCTRLIKRLKCHVLWGGSYRATRPWIQGVMQSRLFQNLDISGELYDARESLLPCCPLSTSLWLVVPVTRCAGSRTSIHRDWDLRSQFEVVTHSNFLYLIDLFWIADDWNVTGSWGLTELPSSFPRHSVQNYRPSNQPPLRTYSVATNQTDQKHQDVVQLIVTLLKLSVT